MMYNIVIQSMAILPEAILALGLIMLISFSFSVTIKRQFVFSGISLVIYVLSLLMLAAGEKYYGIYFSNSIRIDHVAYLFRFFIILTGIVTVILVEYSGEMDDVPRLEMNLLIMGSVLGGLFMVMSSNMIMLYISIEFISLLSYLLTGLTFRMERSLEAAIKYAVFGGVSSGIMLFGMSFLYGLTGNIYLDYISFEIISGPAVNKLMLIAGIVFFFSGMGYKLAMAPYHSWCPDVYEGASTPVTFFYIVPRIAGFGMLLSVMKTAFPQHLTSEFIFDTMAIISAFTMTLGNFSALNQTGIKRLLAYSSIAHGGYALALFSVMHSDVDAAVVYYMFAYLLMTGGTFIIFMLLSANGEGDISLFQGLAFRGKAGAFLAAAMAGFAFSLIGIPPFSGFIGKYFVFSHLIADGRYWLAIAMGINTVLSIYYYMKFLHQSYFMKSKVSDAVIVPLPILLILILISVMNIAAGIFPGLILDFI